MKELKSVTLSKNDITIEVENSGWFTKTKTQVYVGNGTVWHDKTTGKRPGTTMELWLSEIAWKAEKESRLI